MSLDLKEEFKLLAEDETWPVHPSEGMLVLHGGPRNEIIARMEDVENKGRAAFYDAALRRAQLALMVLNENRERTDMTTGPLSYFGINPDHYENVKRRVEEDDDKDG